MKKKLMMILLWCAALVPATAQGDSSVPDDGSEELSSVLVCKLDGTVDTLLLNNVFDIYHSCRDIYDVEQPEVSTLRLRTIVGELVYPLSEIDYVIMPRFGRIVSFLGTTQQFDAKPAAVYEIGPNGESLNPWMTSVTGSFPGNVGDIVTYNWLSDDAIFLSNGQRSNNVKTVSGTTTGAFSFRTDSLVADQYIVYYPGYTATTSTQYNRVTIPAVQTQTGANNSDHLGKSGDCGTAVAVRQTNSSYVFSLDHKSGIICFLPRVEAHNGVILNTLQLRHIAVKADRKLAGFYALSPEGLELFEGTGSDTLTLLTNNYALPLPHERATAQDSAASYMVVAPQPSTTTMKVYYRVFDTRSEIDTVVVKNVSIARIDGATVYPVTASIPATCFQAAITDEVVWDYGQPAVLHGAVNLPISHVGLLWGFNKDLDFEKKEGKIEWTENAGLTFSGQAVDNVRQKAYYYRAYAIDGDKTYWGKVKKFGMNRDIINLGTSVRWSSINMGATTEEDPGGYYAWGELTTKDSYTRANYAYYDSEGSKYIDIGDEICGNPQYDVVTKVWRGCWRMPTRAELQELTNTSLVNRESATVEGQAGMLYKNKNGDADSVMFLPNTGYIRSIEPEYTTQPYYWSATVNNSSSAYGLYGTNPNNTAEKYYGMTIRPVLDYNYETDKGEYLFIRTDSIHYNATQTEADMYGTMRGLDDDITDIKQGFVIGTETAVAQRPITYEQVAVDNGSYHIHLDADDVDKLELGVNYYLRAYMTYDGETYYGEPFEIAALTIETKETDWQVGATSAVLNAVAGGITASVKADIELGFVVGTTRDVTLATEGAIEVDGTSESEDLNGAFTGTLTDIGLKQYFYRAFVRQKGGRVFYGKPQPLGLELVDLGLPSGLRWANINLGAQLPTDAGNFYAWGETTPKVANNQYTQANYQYYKNSAYENIGDDIAGNPDYDAAQVNWKSVWRMPTSTDVQELIDNCTWERVDSTLLNGTKKTGYLVTGPNGNTIFMPQTGYCYNGGTNPSNTNHLATWTSNVYDGDTRYAWHQRNNNSTGKATLEHSLLRYYGLPIRPVAMVNDTLPDKSMIQLTNDGVDWAVGQTTATFHGYLLGLHYHEGATETGFVYATHPISDEAVTTLPEGVSKLKGNYIATRRVASGPFSATMTDVEDETVYFYRAYVIVDGKFYYSEERQFGRKTIDLGLPSGLLWSNINLGASSPDLTGNFYAWGETTPGSDFTRANYTNTLAGPDISGSQNDAAHTAWGGLWRMPTPEDVQELIDNCTWTEVTKYGQQMYKVEANGDSIFIAKHGFMNGTERSGNGTTAAFWTSVLNDQTDANNDRAYATNFHEATRGTDLVARYLGYAVRPVAKTNHELTDHTRFYLTTDSTDWQVGKTSVKLYASMAGLNAEDDNVTLGFVVGYDGADNALRVGADHVTNITEGITMSDITMRGTVAYDKDDIKKDTTYYYRAYVKVGDEYVYGNIHRYGLSLIDMGHGIKWASINVGAQCASDFGKRYAWGELQPKDSYTERTYDYYTNKGYENIGADISGTIYDVAKAHGQRKTVLQATR